MQTCITLVNQMTATDELHAYLDDLTAYTEALPELHLAVEIAIDGYLIEMRHAANMAMLSSSPVSPKCSM
jgi:hypothetical protein